MYYIVFAIYIKTTIGLTDMYKSFDKCLWTSKVII